MKEENKIAIDIVLILSDELNVVACNLSRKIIPPENTRPLVLDNINFIPHISLLMGTTPEGDIPKIKEKLELIFKKYLPLNIRFNKLKNGFVSYLQIEKTEELFNLQREIGNFIKLDYDADRSMFVDSDISDQMINWVNNFKENNLGAEMPGLHLTIGLGDSSFCNIDLPIDIKVDKFAVCHLGYACSCRKILS